MTKNTQSNVPLCGWKRATDKALGLPIGTTSSMTGLYGASNCPCGFEAWLKLWRRYRKLQMASNAERKRLLARIKYLENRDEILARLKRLRDERKAAGS